MAHCHGDEGAPRSLVSDRSRAKAPGFPYSSQPRAGFTLSPPSILLSVWITSRGLPDVKGTKGP